MTHGMLNLSFETAQTLNRALDITHSFFPAFSLLAIIVLFESFLPYKQQFENEFDRWYTYAKIPILVLLNLVAISQGFFGGCLIYYPQTWFNRQFLGIEEPYEYGLFARQYIDQDWWWALQLFYIGGAVLIAWRSWIFLKKRVLLPKK